MLKYSQFSTVVAVGLQHRPFHERVLIALGRHLHLEQRLDTHKRMEFIDRQLKKYPYRDAKLAINFMGAYKFRELFPNEVYATLSPYPFEEPDSAGSHGLRPGAPAALWRLYDPAAGIQSKISTAPSPEIPNGRRPHMKTISVIVPRVQSGAAASGHDPVPSGAGLSGPAGDLQRRRLPGRLPCLFGIALPARMPLSRCSPGKTEAFPPPGTGPSLPPPATISPLPTETTCWSPGIFPPWPPPWRNRTPTWPAAAIPASTKAPARRRPCRQALIQNRPLTGTAWSGFCAPRRLYAGTLEQALPPGGPAGPGGNPPDL